MSESLRQAVRDSGKTMYRVAKDAGVPYPTLHRFMVGKQAITTQTMDKLCAYLRLRLTG